MSTSDLQTMAGAALRKASKHCRVDCDTVGAEGFSVARLTLSDVARVQRWAWRPAFSGEFPSYSFDGINFWWQPRRDENVMVARAVVPSDGWRHRARCNCGVCGSSRRSPERGSKG